MCSTEEEFLLLIKSIDKVMCPGMILEVRLCFLLVILALSCLIFSMWLICDFLYSEASGLVICIKLSIVWPVSIVYIYSMWNSSLINCFSCEFEINSSRRCSDSADNWTLHVSGKWSSKILHNLIACDAILLKLNANLSVPKVIIEDELLYVLQNGLLGSPCPLSVQLSINYLDVPYMRTELHVNCSRLHPGLWVVVFIFCNAC